MNFDIELKLFCRDLRKMKDQIEKNKADVATVKTEAKEVLR